MKWVSAHRLQASACILCTLWSLSDASQRALLGRESRQQARSQASTIDGRAVQVPLASCDVSSSGPICYSGQQQALVPSAVPNGLVGHWKFDGKVAYDASGNGNHGVTPLVHGPSPAGSGHSAFFKKSFLMVPNSVFFQSAEFTYSFWVYLKHAAEDNAAWCPILRKGIHQVETSLYENAPALTFNSRTSKLRVSLTTMASGIEDQEHVESNARLLPNRWIHIAIVHHSTQSTLLLYVNGIVDKRLTLQGQLVLNNFPLYVGSDPFAVDSCDLTMYVDELRAYNRAVFPHELGAEAAPALGGVDPSYVHLGCTSCTVEQAAQSCPASRHVCSAVELHTGGYQVARSLGWLCTGTHVWTHSAIMKSQAAALGEQAQSTPADQLGLALCCDGEP
mmetsp:Transcript_75507/g.125439  ORF Transcript_75507/g.125439 Transcript_75507/m.125439 type:complete len:392 (-) Transcript_75507:112-1287(-)